MAKSIVSENVTFVLPSHRGLTPLEIIQDCLEKAQLLADLGISSTDNMEGVQRPQLLSMVDDWIAIAQHQLETFRITHEELKEQSL